jgi:hypothetical protein
MNWLFGRQDEPRTPSDPIVQPAAPEPDSPAALAALLFQANRFVNANAGQLPGEAVVAARRVTDVADTVLFTTRDRDLDIQARVSLNGMLRDYLPTTLRAYLALDPSVRNQPRPNGITPVAALNEQLDFLLSSASEVLAAVQNDDANALVAQGNFLRTKFGRSELDL